MMTSDRSETAGSGRAGGDRADRVHDHDDPFLFLIDAPRGDAPTVVMGYVAEIHGPEGTLLPCELSRHEAAVVVRYWCGRIVEVEAEWRFLQQSSSTGMRVEGYAAERLGKLVDAGLTTWDQVRDQLDQLRRKADILTSDASGLESGTGAVDEDACDRATGTEGADGREP